MNASLTPKQQQVLDTIKAYIKENNSSPSLKNIMEELSYSQLSSVQRHVDALRAKGMLPERKPWSRGVNVHSTTQKYIPLIGTVECGDLSLAEENVEAYVPYPEDKLRQPQSNYFFVKAHGDSMNESKFRIQEGDYLLVRQQATASRGDVVIALLGDDATCKVFSRTKDDLPKLQPESSNPRHKPRVLLEDFSVLGVVEDLIKPRRGAYA